MQEVGAEVRGRERGPSVTGRKRLKAEAAAAADVAAAMLRHTRTSRQMQVVNNGSPMVACTLGRGRAAINAPLNLGGEVRLMEERKQLKQKS